MTSDNKFKIVGGPKYISELGRYKDPFTGEIKLFHPSKWPLYVKQEAKKYLLSELSLAYQETKDPIVREVLRNIMMHHHDSVVQ